MFFEEIKKVSQQFVELVKKRHVKVYSQFDTDGITSAAIFSKILLRLGVNFELKILKQLNRETIGFVKANEDDMLVFLDFGSGQLDLLKEFIEKVPVFVIDHHETKNFVHENLFHINPMIYGEEEYSTSVISYWFAKSISDANSDLIDLGILGAIGDEQDEKWEFKGAIREIVEEGQKLGKISVIKDLRIYGRRSRPIHKALAYTYDPYIPGISGSEANAIKFLKEIGIDAKNGYEWKRMVDLTEEEKQKLASAIIYERLNESNSEDIFGEVYLLLSRPEEFQDARELSTIINACSRIGRHDIALRIALGDYSVVKEMNQILENYKKLLYEGILFTKENLIEKENAYYILAGKSIRETLIGTVISILVNSLPKQKPIFGLAEGDTYIKISARTTNENINLKEILSKVIEKVGGEAGGHKKAAGAYIDKGKEQEFIKATEEVLKNG